MEDVILAIDEGTTNAKAVTMNRAGDCLTLGTHPLHVNHPKPAWTAQDPYDIIDAVRIASQAALCANVKPIGIGISNQRESVLIWDKTTGQALTHVAVWQCRRSEAFCEALLKGNKVDIIQRKTGLPIDPLFPAAKIRWFLDRLEHGHERAEAGEISAGTIDSWLVWKLSGHASFVTDMSNAARTQLFNIHTQNWDPELCDIFGVPMNCLAEILPSSGPRAYTRDFNGLPDNIPIYAQIGDSHAALYGQGGFDRGTIKATYGTGSSLMTPVDEIRGGDYRLATTVAWHDGALKYGLEGNITHTGAGAAFMGGLIGETNMTRLADMAQNATSDGVYFVPALSGLGAPYWMSGARGIITGLTEAATQATLARAGFEAIAFQVADVFYLMEEMAGQNLAHLLVDGGPTKNRWLMQFQANLLGRPVIRQNIAEISARGAGFLAGKAHGWWPNHEDLRALNGQVEMIEPNGDEEAVRGCYQGWKQAIAQALV